MPLPTWNTLVCVFFFGNFPKVQPPLFFCISFYTFYFISFYFILLDFLYYFYFIIASTVYLVIGIGVSFLWERLQ